MGGVGRRLAAAAPARGSPPRRCRASSSRVSRDRATPCAVPCDGSARRQPCVRRFYRPPRSAARARGGTARAPPPSRCAAGRARRSAPSRAPAAPPARSPPRIARAAPPRRSAPAYICLTSSSRVPGVEPLRPDVPGIAEDGAAARSGRPRSCRSARAGSIARAGVFARMSPAKATPAGGMTVQVDLVRGRAPDVESLRTGSGRRTATAASRSRPAAEAPEPRQQQRDQDGAEARCHQTRNLMLSQIQGESRSRFGTRKQSGTAA